jgi:hypothetical protein
MKKDSELVKYLEEVLALAKRGQVLCFVGSACTAGGAEIVSEPERMAIRSELQVRVGVSLNAEHVGKLDDGTLTQVFIECAKGAAMAEGTLDKTIRNELATRAAERKKAS